MSILGWLCRQTSNHTNGRSTHFHMFQKHRFQVTLGNVLRGYSIPGTYRVQYMSARSAPPLDTLNCNMFHRITFQTESLSLKLHTMWCHDLYTGSIAGVPGSLYIDLYRLFTPKNEHDNGRQII